MQFFSGRTTKLGVQTLRKLALSLGVLAAFPALAQQASVDVWSAMSPANQAVFERVIKDFNSQQKEVKVTLKNFGTQEELRAAAVQAVQKKDTPSLIQVSDNMLPDYLIKQKSIIPLADLMKSYPIREAQWFLPQTTTFVKDRAGNIQAFPLMAEAPVLFYNRDLFKKAGLNPDQPPKTWDQMRDAVVRLIQAGVPCAYTSSWQSWIHMENTSAIHNVPYATNDNGIKGSGNLQFNGLLHVRHLAMLTSWSRSGVMLEHSREGQADRHFVDGQCAMLTSGSATLGTLQAQSKFSFGMAPLPYHSSETSSPSSPLVGGSSLWVMADRADAKEKSGVASFLNYLATPTVAAEWSKQTGFLPLNQGANQILSKNFYSTIPGLSSLVASLGRAPSTYSRGFFVNNYEKVKNLVDDALNDAFDKSKSARQALDDLVKKAAVAAR